MEKQKQEITWVKWFLSLPLSKYFVEIDSDYINNIFNYYGIRQKIMNFKEAFDLIKGPYIPPKDRTRNEIPDIDDYGICLYGLLHNRYLLTNEGIDKMYNKYIKEDFPKCPRALCRKTKCLPCGISDNMGQAGLKIFCPQCRGVYHYDACQLDGAFFGTSYINILLAKYPKIIPQGKLITYTPTLYGFQICPDAEIDALEEDVRDETNQTGSSDSNDLITT